MSLRQLGGSQVVQPGGAFVVARRPPQATHVAFLCFPGPNHEFPVPAGCGPRSHPILHFLDRREVAANDVAPPDVDDLACIAQIDFTSATNLYGQPIRLPSDCVAVSVEDGDAAGSTAITRGRLFWYQEA